MKQHGSDGIPRQGHEAQYAEELWLEGPSAFWLHPEGPDSDTTPEEWLAKKPKGGSWGIAVENNWVRSTGFVIRSWGPNECMAPHHIVGNIIHR